MTRSAFGASRPSQISAHDNNALDVSRPRMKHGLERHIRLIKRKTGSPRGDVDLALFDRVQRVGEFILGAGVAAEDSLFREESRCMR